MQRRNVLLPEPLAPMMEITSPFSAVIEMPLSTSSVPKLLCRSLTTIGVASFITVFGAAWFIYYVRQTGIRSLGGRSLAKRLSRGQGNHGGNPRGLTPFSWKKGSDPLAPPLAPSPPRPQRQ